MKQQEAKRLPVIWPLAVIMTFILTAGGLTYLGCAPAGTETTAVRIAKLIKLQQQAPSSAAPAESSTPPCNCEPCQATPSTGLGDNLGSLTTTSVARAARQVWGYESPITDLQTMQKYAKAFEVLPDYTFPAANTSMVSFWKQLAPYFHEFVHTRGNGMFDECDAAVLHAFVRHIKPQRVFEVGSGFSTGVVSKALDLNAAAGSSKAKHLCVEPYRASVLRAQGINVEIIERPVQEVDLSLFDELQPGDMLFLDNSHVTMPYGDVIFEFLWILPRLKPGVYVHIHDILLPYDYIPRWMTGELRQYTEQYMLAAFLYGNVNWQVIFHNGHLNNTAGHLLSAMDEASKAQYLQRCSFDHKLQPTVAMPASIYLQKVN